MDFPLLGPKGAIAFFGLFHTSVASMSIGTAFVVTIAQVIGYRTGIRFYDQFAKRSQLFHVCIYNVGTINAIGLVFALSGLYPQFWEQIFTHFFWALMVEELLFLLLATTLTFHYFFWDKLWGHKRLHIILGAMLTPLFILQMYMINAIGGFMLTPGFQEEGVLSQYIGVLGYDTRVMYSPSFLMLQLHRTFANFSYAGFLLAGWAGIQLMRRNLDPVRRSYYEHGGRLAFYTGFASFLTMPILGYFYSWVLKYHAEESFWNLMLGAGDVVKGGIDLWWVKHVFVTLMLGMAIVFYHRQDRFKRPFSLPAIMVYSVGVFYFLFYVAMGMVMTWRFFYIMLAIAVGAGILAWGLMKMERESGRAVFVVMAIASFMTVLLGGWSREAARPRFVDRVSAYDNIYVEEERQVNQFLETQNPETRVSEAATPGQQDADTDFEIRITVRGEEEGLQADQAVGDLSDRSYVPVSYQPYGYSLATQLFTDTERYGYAQANREQRPN